MVVNILKKWEKEHFRKVLGEIKQKGIDFSLDNLEEIIECASYDIRSSEQGGECSYYPSGEKCHDLDDLNCFLCGD